MSSREIARAAQGATLDEKRVARLEGIINSMTPQERVKPELLKASRKRRIDARDGVSVQDSTGAWSSYDSIVVATTFAFGAREMVFAYCAAHGVSRPTTVGL